MPMMKRKKAASVGFVALGCPKNQVNAERMMADLQAAGMKLKENVFNGADVVVVNTCCFVDDAKKEAIESILEMAQLKQDGVVKKILIAGCMAQRYQDEILQEIPEVDAVIGLGANDSIVEHVQQVLAGEQVAQFPELHCLKLSGQRKRTGPTHWAYLQVADGCSNGCTYCAIPEIRGPFRAREPEDILAEAQQLAQDGVRELVLIAQDTTAYSGLPALLCELCKVDGIHWVRLLYCYPDEITDELIEVMASEDKIVNYIDLPLQHADDHILNAMGRRGTQADIASVLGKLRAAMPGIAIRTTFITGFPGENDAAFEALAQFVEQQRFAHMGCFAFSPQEGTEAAALPNQIENEIAQQRAEILTQQQAAIAEQRKQESIGQVLEVMVDEYDTYNDCYIGRSQFDAPEIDSFITFVGRRTLQAGDIAQVEILALREDALVGKIV